jgi:hypothetical protein
LCAVIPAGFVRTFRQRLTAEKPLAGLRPDTLSFILYLVQTLKDSTACLRHQDVNDYADLVQHIVENPYLNGETLPLDGALRMS